jgi:two-component system LytT family sensor kinase
MLNLVEFAAPSKVTLMKSSQNKMALGFLAAALLTALLGSHAYLVAIYTHETAQWFDNFLRIAVTWFLWAAFFPVILSLAGNIRFEAGRKVRSIFVLILAGIGIAALHVTIQILLNDWLFHPGQKFMAFGNIFKTQFGVSFMTRFFVCQALVAVCVALELYRKARETEIQVSQMETRVLQARVESLKIQLDPDDLFENLKQLSKLMYRDLDEAESMIARMGEELRTRLVPLAFEQPDQTETTQTENESNDLENTIPDISIDANPVRKWLIIIGIFTSLGFYFTFQIMLVRAIRGIPMDWPQHLLDCSGWYMWALLTPIVLKISSLHPVRKSHWPRQVMMHLSILISMWVIATAGIVGVRWASNLGQQAFLDIFPMTLARSPFWLDIVCYSTIVAVGSALRYHRRFQFGKIRTIRLNAQFARAHLQALKMQLHPHFLYNSLNSLSELMREDPVAGEEMIHNLETFLRLTVNHNDEQEVLFEQELEFLKCYLAIENVRFQDRLSVKMEIEPPALKVPVPNLLLQPIVENAIRHGIAPRSKPGEIEIRAKRCNGVLQVSVRDNGPGLKKLRKKTNALRSGLGLANTRERLNQLYGDSHRFELINAPEGGLIVSLEIPVSRVL